MRVAWLILAGLLAAVGAVRADVPPGFTDDYAASLARAKAENKLVVADFSGSDWCFWCRRLDDEILTRPEFLSVATNRYVLLMIDSPRDKSRLSATARTQNPQLVRRYGVTAFPTVLLLDGEGAIVGETGFVGGGPENYLRHLAELVDRIPLTLAWVKPLRKRLSAFYARYSDEMSTAVRASAGASPAEVARVEGETTLRLVAELEQLIAEESAREIPEAVAEERRQRLAEAAAGAQALRDFAERRLRKSRAGKEEEKRP